MAPAFQLAFLLLPLQANVGFRGWRVCNINRAIKRRWHVYITHTYNHFFFILVSRTAGQKAVKQKRQKHGQEEFIMLSSRCSDTLPLRRLTAGGSQNFSPVSQYASFDLCGYLRSAISNSLFGKLVRCDKMKIRKRMKRYIYFQNVKCKSDIIM